MITELKKKEIQTVKEMVDLFTAKISDFKSDMDHIDEKYRKIIEEEKSELKKNLADCKSQLKVWKKMFDSFDSTLVSEAIGDYVSTATVDVISEPAEEDTPNPVNDKEDEGNIIDTLFEDNNEDTPEEDDVEYSENADSSFPDGAKTPELTDEWPEEETPETKVEEKSESDFEDDDWPEFPEEWK